MEPALLGGLTAAGMMLARIGSACFLADKSGYRASDRGCQVRKKHNHGEKLPGKNSQ
jgi:hypothetical protein